MTEVPHVAIGLLVRDLTIAKSVVNDGVATNKAASAYRGMPKSYVRMLAEMYRYGGEESIRRMHEDAARRADAPVFRTRTQGVAALPSDVVDRVVAKTREFIAARDTDRALQYTPRGKGTCHSQVLQFLVWQETGEIHLAGDLARAMPGLTHMDKIVEAASRGGGARRGRRPKSKVHSHAKVETDAAADGESDPFAGVFGKFFAFSSDGSWTCYTLDKHGRVGFYSDRAAQLAGYEDGKTPPPEDAPIARPPEVVALNQRFNLKPASVAKWKFVTETK